jgi:hypothetical protein
MSGKRFAKMTIVPVLVLTAVGNLVWACCGDYNSLKTTPELVPQLAELSQGSTLRDRRAWKDRIEVLRERQQEGLDAAIAHRNHRVTELGGETFAEIEHLDRAIDEIAAQKFAAASGLFWHTTRESAIAESARTKRPIISLRMLGRLDENLSCANSRFFRTMLYPDPAIASRLRDNFVLHWQSVRDVPIVTIDFGQGRKLEQPLTGNSVHLVLDSQGQPFDAMPGLVSPAAFAYWLDDTTNFWNTTKHQSDETFWFAVQEYHRHRATSRRGATPLAIRADQSVADLNPLDLQWSQLAAEQSVQLAATSLRLLDVQRPAEAAMLITASKYIAEVPLMRMVQPVETAVGRDTVFNLYALQTKLDDWFGANAVPLEYHAVTNRIYAELFLMPLDDPWLGLSPSSYFTALDRGGRIDPNTAGLLITAPDATGGLE